VSGPGCGHTLRAGSLENLRTAPAPPGLRIGDRLAVLQEKRIGQGEGIRLGFIVIRPGTSTGMLIRPPLGVGPIIGPAGVLPKAGRTIRVARLRGRGTGTAGGSGRSGVCLCRKGRGQRQKEKCTGRKPGPGGKQGSFPWGVDSINGRRDCQAFGRSKLGPKERKHRSVRACVAWRFGAQE